MLGETHKNEPIVDESVDGESKLNLLQQANAKLKPTADQNGNIKNEKKLDNIIANTTKNSGAINKYPSHFKFNCNMLIEFLTDRGCLIFRIIILYNFCTVTTKKKGVSPASCGRNKIFHQGANDGFFYSNRFPNQYPPNCKQSWEIQCPVGKTVAMSLHFMNVRI